MYPPPTLPNWRRTPRPVLVRRIEDRQLENRVSALGFGICGLRSQALSMLHQQRSLLGLEDNIVRD